MNSEVQHSLILPTVSKNEDNPCMPLAINVVLKYWGEEKFVEEAHERSKRYSNIKGSLFVEGLEIAESHGFTVHTYKGELKELKKRIDQGIPIIVIMPGIYEAIQHATIVTGYSTEEGRILTYIPEPDKEGAFPEREFLDYWEQDGSISVMILPKDIVKRIKEDELEQKKSYRMCLEAERFIQTRNLQSAISLVKNALHLNERNALAWSILGSVYNDLASEEAIKCFQRSIDLNPRFYLSYRGMGNYHLKKGEYLLAEKYYTEAINLHAHRFGPIYKNRAIARMNTNDREGAKSDLSRYLEECPTAHDRSEIESSINQL
ncbi:MAG: C39 family peptidase [Thermoproteota archaeon]|nr:C39 family peptidase [Thermoproteota archaeon]